MSNQVYVLTTPGLEVKFAFHSMRAWLTITMRGLNRIKSEQGWNETERELYQTIVRLREQNPELS